MLLGRTDDAWNMLQSSAAKGLPDIAERLKFTHLTRVGIVHMRRGTYNKRGEWQTLLYPVLFFLYVVVISKSTTSKTSLNRGTAAIPFCVSVS